MKEGYIKLPKVLKDMLDCLVMKKKVHEGVEAVGILHSDLAMQCIEKFGAEVFPVLVQVWQVKQKITRIRELIATLANNEEKEDSSWSDDCLKDNDDTLVIPLTAGPP
ncbi:hypothetical protein BCV72DRAFT_310613 [Rhizopus microsporus var. microsporus]|uniref:Uncharacterized protein n=2 Tax=Rhizopus microsporus TaxID=58291 RepID=A0A2G4SXA3_RHIZD|nr:uncharacterized protein RHIMIDRAFT_236468 [Rhizopus microsporus ATCC 52813]ORE00816.1 hypothetical protein BCV72DRAFT_310613 [Rhizopus microsporus var. microsporus]PHZ13399.1 hypothetical protein RHIMIDRAFT_236468 [Rhizopus microsporus ATCC 52813]